MIDYKQIALDRLTGQFKNSRKINDLMAHIVGPLEYVERDADDFVSKRWIDTAEGLQLDGCGEIVGEKRQGKNDDDYREAIKFRVFLNISKGTPGTLIDAIYFLTAPTDAQYLESYPATSILFTNGFFIDEKIQPAIQNISPSAISTVPVCVSFADKPFRFARASIPGELFVNSNEDYLTANGSDIQLSQGDTAIGGASLGGCVPAELDVGGYYLDVGGPTLAVYNPNTINTLGHYNLTGVFQ